MKVLMVGPFGLRPHGTISRRALPLAKALAARGHEVEVVLPPWSCPEDSGRAWREDGVSVYNIVLPPPMPVVRHAAIVWRLLRRALARRPQVLHFFKPKGYSGLTAMLVWWLARLRLIEVRVVLDTDDWEGEGGWNDVRPYSWLERRFFAWQESWGMTHCHALTVASRELEKRAWKMGIKRERIRYVPNGSILDQVALDEAAGVRVRAEWGLGDDPVVLLYTRFFEFEPSRVIRVWNRVALEAPSTQFLVVGSGLSGEEKHFLALAREAGLGSSSAYAGWQGEEELPGYLAAADVAICPLEDTLWNRARCSVKLADLMAAGLAVVAEDVGQVSEYIEHLSSGYLVPQGDERAFAAGVLQLLGDRQLRDRLGEQARRRVVEQFARHKLAGVMEEVYVA